MIGIRVFPEVEDIGLDISEHAKSMYSNEEEFLLGMDKYTDDRKRMKYSLKRSLNSTKK
jgi:Amt family ammonium transporter